MTFEQGERIINLLEAIAQNSGSGVIPTHITGAAQQIFPKYPDIVVPAMGKYERNTYTPRFFNLFYDRYDERFRDINCTDDKNPKYLHPANGTSLKSSPITSACNTGADLRELNYPHKKLPLRELEEAIKNKRENEINVYPISMWCNMDFDNIIHQMSEEARTHVREGRMSMLLQIDGEAFGPDEHKWIRKLSEGIIQHGMHNANIVLTCADLHFASNYRQWCEVNIDIKNKFQFRKVLSIDYFGYQYCKQWLQRTGQYDWGDNRAEDHAIVVAQRQGQVIWNEDEIFDHTPTAADKKVDFLCLNGVPRPHRIACVSELYRLGLENNYISSMWRYHSTPSIAHSGRICVDIERNYLATEEQISYFKSNYVSDLGDKTIKLDVSVNELNSDDRKGDVKIYKESYFSLVTETRFDVCQGAIDGSGIGDACRSYNAPFMLTEKTYKPIANFHAFIIMGSNGILAYLQSEGYRTFPQMFDESYDKIVDDKDRFQAILKTVKDWCDKPEEQKQAIYDEFIVPAISHNVQRFRDKYEIHKLRMNSYYNCIGDHLV